MYGNRKCFGVLNTMLHLLKCLENLLLSSSFKCMFSDFCCSGQVTGRKCDFLFYYFIMSQLNGIKEKKNFILWLYM